MSSRKRQSMEDALVSLDTNVTQHPSSAKRKKRLSLLPNNVTIGAPRLMRQQSKRLSSVSRIPPSSISRRRSTLRRNYGDAVVPSNRSNRLSQGSQFLPPSSGGRFYDETVVSMTPSVQQRLYMGINNRDPRPVRDRSYQAKMQRDLFEYLSTAKFDIVMKQQLTARTMKSPTQKEFVLMFQFLYKKIDPGYRFLRSVEQDIYSILKFLEYPYLDTINKSQLSAVGGTNWPVFLAMLHWLLQLVQQMQMFDLVDFSQLPEPLKDDNAGNYNNSVVFNKEIEDSVIVRENTALDRLFTSFALKSYKSFLSTGTEDYSEYYSEMESEYKQCTQDVVNKTNKLVDENENLVTELREKGIEQIELNSKVERTRALAIDVSKFQKYVDLQNQRSEKWPLVLERAKKDIESIKKSIEDADNEKEKIVADLKEKGFTLKDIEQMHKERAELSSNFDMVESKQKLTMSSIEDKTGSLTKVFESLKQLVDGYNTKVYAIFDGLDGVPLDGVPHLTITSFSDQLVNDDDKLGLRPDEIVPELKQSEIKVKLALLKESIQQSHLTNRDECIRLQEQLDDLKLKSVSLKDQLEELEDKLTKSKKDYSELNDQKVSEVSSNQFQLEQDTKEIRLLSTQLGENQKQIEEEFSKAETELRRLTSSLSEQRNELLIRLANEMGYAVSFKTGIMGDIEVANGELADECKEQLANDDSDST
ncbi:hypothetical protein FOA43_001816 [Brettanomyces nanus]|uniref:Kinetochore protein NDC80 n=1 Tax=Eeniella nana TaxID=13502 RepID=A0A875RZ96_EENNA|nr:uncharacterized protein FOA43_001816 [Brettanomyces nanus]QPG74486.1 hypothetical protein FOA43_001816 [Brettanomyces nanus]